MKEFFSKISIENFVVFGVRIIHRNSGVFFSTGVHIVQMIVIYETSHIENVDYNRIW